jgi:hypothetical protein
MSGPPPPLPSWATEDIDLARPNVARLYDYLLGGVHNFAVDRELADWLDREVPGSRRAVWASRSFQQRAVRYCAALGIDQYLEIGSGIPTEGQVHEIVRETVPDARVVYVDNDPIAVLHGRALLADDPGCAMLHADLRSPESVLDDPATRALLDLDRPVAVTMVSVLEVIPDSDDPGGLVRRLTGALTAGSHLVIGHFGLGPEALRPGLTAPAISAIVRMPIHPREPARLRELLGDFVPIPPGVVRTHEWRPESGLPVRAAARSPGFAVVGARF